MNAESSESRVVKTFCNMCGVLACGLNIHVEGGKIRDVTKMEEHPFGHLCVKSQGLIDWVYSEERVTHPLKKAGGGWEKISWDEALGIISDKLQDVKEKYGARALVVHLGVPFLGRPVQKLAQRFCDVYGSPNYTSGGSFCFNARAMGHGLTFNYDAAALFPSYRDAQCIVLWGTNPTQSSLLQAAGISAARKRGAKLVVIDPRTTPLAKEADIHAQVRPGTDCALALGLLNVIIAEELYDKSFVEEWTVGFDRLVKHLKNYTPEKVEAITWAPAEAIVDIARMYASSKPATVSQGVSLDHCTNGLQTSRAICTLVAITGNLDVPGGNTYNPNLETSELRMRDNISTEEAVGAEYPLFSRLLNESTVVTVTEAILTGKPYPVKALIVQGSNPVLTWPNANKVEEAFGKLELLVVMDLFMTETAKLADLVLPAATFLEGRVMRDFPPLVFLGNKAIESRGDCLEDWRFWVELGRGMGYEQYFPWENYDDFVRALLQPTSVDFGQLDKRPGGVFHSPRERQRYLKGGFNTPSGKAEIYSETLEGYGYSPLPTFEEPAESPVTKPDLARKYPLILITGARVSAFTHSQHRNVPVLRKHMPQPLVEINPRTAESLGILDGDLVTIESPRGSIKSYAKLTEDIHPKVVSIQHGWSEANANVLTDDMGRDPVSGYPGFRSVLCRIRKEEKK